MITYAQALAKFKQPHAKWTPTLNQQNEWEGTCQKCNQIVPAINLSLTRLPFGRGEIWACKGGCND